MEVFAQPFNLFGMSLHSKRKGGHEKIVAAVSHFLSRRKKDEKKKSMYCPARPNRDALSSSIV